MLKTLEARQAFVSPAPLAQLLAYILNLFPQEPCGAIRTSGFELDDRCRHFDHTCVKINGAASRKLKGAACPWNHFLTDEPLRCSENFFGPSSDIIDQEPEFRF